VGGGGGGGGGGGEGGGGVGLWVVRVAACNGGGKQKSRIEQGVTWIEREGS